MNNHENQGTGTIDTSIVIVAKNEELNIQRCLSSILEQHDVDLSVVEIILVDDGSTDNTVMNALNIAPNIKIINNPTCSISSNRNAGWRAASGRYIAFIDADCAASPLWLYNLLKEIGDKSVAAVGGPNTPPHNYSKFYTSLAVVLNTYIGSRGSVQGAVYKDKREVRHLPGLNVLFRKEVLEDIGGYDECFARIGEDEDISLRVSSLGYKLLYTPNASVVHYQRSTFRKWSKNMFTYGKGRTWLIKRHPNSFSMIFLLPLFAFIAFPIYFPVIGIYSLGVSIRANAPGLAGYIWAHYVATHIPYAFGMLYGLIQKGDNDKAIARSKYPSLYLMILKNAGNIGDEAILTACVNELLSINSDVILANFYVLSIGPSGMEVNILPLSCKARERMIRYICSPSYASRNIGLVSLIQFQRLFAFIGKRANLVVCGGQWFHDLSILKHLLVTLLLFIIRLFGGRTGLMGVGVGPLRSLISRLLMRLAFSKESFLMVRDEASKLLLDKCGLNHGFVGADLASGMLSSDSLLSIPTTTIGISPCAWAKFVNLYKRDSTEIENTLDNLVTIIDFIISRRRHVLLLPTMNPEDKKLCEVIIERLGPTNKITILETEKLLPSQFQHVISQLDLLISMRMHPIIFASNVSTPFIGINYADKVYQFAKAYGCVDNIINMDHEWSYEVIKKIHSHLQGGVFVKNTVDMQTKNQHILRRSYMYFKIWLNHRQSV